MAGGWKCHSNGIMATLFCVESLTTCCLVTSYSQADVAAMEHGVSDLFWLEEVSDLYGTMVGALVSRRWRLVFVCVIVSVSILCVRAFACLLKSL